MASEPQYIIIRFYRDDAIPKHIVRFGLNLEDVQEHCERPDTSTEDWFDGYSTTDNYPGLVAQHKGE